MSMGKDIATLPAKEANIRDSERAHAKAKNFIALATAAAAFSIAEGTTPPPSSSASSNKKRIINGRAYLRRKKKSR